VNTVDLTGLFPLQNHKLNVPGCPASPGPGNVGDRMAARFGGDQSSLLATTTKPVAKQLVLQINPYLKKIYGLEKLPSMRI
jgi:hypothetical protein